MNDSDKVHLIAEQTKKYQHISFLRKSFSTLLEILSYLLGLLILLAAFYIPVYLEARLDLLEDEIGFYTLDPEDRVVWKQYITLALAIISMLFFIIGILLHKVRKKTKTLNAVGKICNV
ncbi:MAG TPA: hypothetical protein VNB90_13455 [Cytophagaceae bacterium]|nr:hypothetical protein [Cytophagaceae bacterium]